MVLLADKNRSTSRLLWMLIWLMNKEEELGSDEHDPWSVQEQGPGSAFLLAGAFDQGCPARACQIDMSLIW